MRRRVLNPISRRLGPRISTPPAAFEHSSADLEASLLETRPLPQHSGHFLAAAELAEPYLGGPDHPHRRRPQLEPHLPLAFRPCWALLPLLDNVQHRIWLCKSLYIPVMGTSDTPKTDQENPLPAEVIEKLHSIASKWSDIIDPKALQVIRLKGAMTNEIYQIKWPTKTGEMSKKVLVRMFGQGVDVFFSREDETKTFEWMSEHGQGPLLLERFQYGRIEEFIRAKTLSASDLRDPEISAVIAAKLREYHDLDLPGPKEIKVWDRLRDWLVTAKQLCSEDKADVISLDGLEEEITELDKKLSGNQCIGFCHNDLQYGNIMMDEQTKSITIIDYEYSSYNPVAFDIANHFCEMAADYHSEEPHLLDYNKYPDLEERKRFVHKYLSSCPAGCQPSDNEVEQLLEDVEKYTLASHLYWGIWGAISHHVNRIEFDFMEYGKQRLQQYWRTKPNLLGSTST